MVEENDTIDIASSCINQIRSSMSKLILQKLHTSNVTVAVACHTFIAEWKLPYISEYIGAATSNEPCIPGTKQLTGRLASK